VSVARVSGILFAGALAACASRPYQDPAYASLPRVNLLLVDHGGIASTQMAREVRYEIETLLASDRIALAGGPYVEGAPEFSLDLVDEGPLYLSMGGVRGEGTRILAAYIYRRQPYEREIELVGEFRSVMDGDFVSSVKLAEMVAAVIRRGLST
jgi:hypothetical protein